MRYKVQPLRNFRNCIHLFIYLFLPEGIITFNQVGKVKAELCAHYLGVRKGYVAYQMETTPENGLNRVQGRLITRSASG